MSSPSPARHTTRRRSHRPGRCTPAACRPPSQAIIQRSDVHPGQPGHRVVGADVRRSGEGSRASRTASVGPERWGAYLEDMLVLYRHLGKTAVGQRGDAPQPGRPRPIPARTGHLRARFRRPGACTATLSRTVCAGSSPAGALVRGINSNALTILARSDARLVTCGNAHVFRALPPVHPGTRTPAAEGQAQRPTITTATRPLPCPKAVAPPPISAAKQGSRSSAGTARARPSSQPDRRGGDLAYLSHSAVSAPLSYTPGPAVLHGDRDLLGFSESAL
jgi:hypothetical protein